jgi:predicted transcriptional regulator
MSLNISAEVEARILGNAEQAGVSIEDYLDQVLGESEEFAAEVRRLEATCTSPSREEIQGKISRGLAQLDRGECASGEEFMADLLSGIDDVERRAG